MPNLNFETNNTLYMTHGLHSFAAKCPPQLVKYGLQYYSKPGEIVLDPMAGSGTTLVESYLMGRSAYGYDIDPLSRIIARVKCRPLSDKVIEKAYVDVKERTERDLKLLRSIILPSAVRSRATPPDFTNRDYWFEPSVIDALSLLSFHINETSMSPPARDFLWVAFSSLILAKNSVANARDIIHSRHHYFKHPNPPDVLTKLDARIRVMRRQMAEFHDRCQRWPAVKVAVRSGDARSLSTNDETIDLIFTSPPYATALDYPRAHFLAVAWMQAALGITLDEYKSKASNYIGSERGSLPRELMVDESLSQFDLTRSIINGLSKRSPRHAALTMRYFVDMYKVFAEMYRVLKDRRHAIIVVCPSHIRKLDVPTHKIFVEMGNAIGLKLKYEYQRTINERLRLLPYMQDAFGKRMSTEYVLIFQKRG
jgi:DNA modification methylase